MKAYFFVTLLLLLATGCATHERTKYGPENNAGGYTDSNVDEKLVVSRFSGNGYTDPQLAFLFSQFRAVEKCNRDGRLSRVIAIENDTKNKDVQKTVGFSSTSKNQNPFFFSGVDSFSNSSSETWSETITYPAYETAYICVKDTWALKVGLRKVSEQDMKLFTRDLMSALQVENIQPESPNRDVLKIGDIVFKVGNTRIRGMYDLVAAVDGAENKADIPMTIIRDGKYLDIKGKAVDVSSELSAETAKLVSRACVLPDVAVRSICNSRKTASQFEN